MKIITLPFLLIAYCNTPKAQSYAHLNSFTTNEGLPSNHIYDIAEDKKGFLWLATDNGLSRFDGQYFKNYSVKEGLPSNDVLQVLTDGDGIIWANCYKHLPAYFDEINNKFTVFSSNDTVNEISRTFMLTSVLSSGKVVFYNNLGYAVFDKKKLVKCRRHKDRNPLLMFYNKGDKYLSVSDNLVYKKGKSIFRKYFFWLNDKIADSCIIGGYDGLGTRSIADNHKVYTFVADGTVHRLSLQHISPIRCTTDWIKIPEQIHNSKASNNTICIAGKKGTLFILDKEKMHIQHKIPVGIFLNCAYTDKNGNLWVGTLDKGLLYFSKNGISSIAVPANLIHQDFLSISITESKQILAGNYYGEVLQTDGVAHHAYHIPGKNNTLWTRKIFSFGSKKIVVADNGISIDFKRITPLPNGRNYDACLKTAVLVNDSIVVLGSITGLIRYNINTHTSKPLNSLPERVVSLAKSTENIVYYIGAGELYKYDCIADSSCHIPLESPLANEKINIITIAPNGNLWIGTSGGSILIVQYGNIATVIPNYKGLPENITCMIALKNQIWIGSKKGISIIEYTCHESGSIFSYSIRNLSKTDGLPSNTVNDFAYYNDTVYAATENGIASIPFKYKYAEFEIFPQISSVKINQLNEPVMLDYSLNSNQTDILLEFAGVDLTGHFKNFEYTVGDMENFIKMTGNTLNMRLSSGSSTIYIRGVDVNNKPGKEVLKMSFFVKAPFYKTMWFWLFIAIASTILLAGFIGRRKINKQRTAFIQQLSLEQQRNKMAADLHDDIGASLSSLQLNSAVAGKLVDADPSKAKLLLDKVEKQSKNISEKIGDFIWSIKTVEDEFMTIGSRIKNYAADMLGTADIEYELHIDDEVNRCITDAASRKSIVLICKEAINNAVKYSRAPKVIITLKIEQNNLVLQIMDNGTGFSQETLKGNGITNMRKRTEELNGRFRITSAPDNGTNIYAAIPLIP